jgi:hypothetical protein
VDNRELDSEELEERLERAKRNADKDLSEKYPRLVWGAYIVCGLLFTGIVFGVIHHFVKGG